MRKLLLSILLISLGFAGGLVLTGRMKSAEVTIAQPARPAPAPVQRAAPGADPVIAAGTDFSDVAARTVGAVTNISALQVVNVPNSPFAADPFFRQFFDDRDLFGFNERRGQSAGSGVIVTRDGYVLTNNHVVGEHMREVTVVLSDRRERAAKLVGVDPMTDLAVLKIDGANLPLIPWGDSSQLRVAEWVLAIGNPYQLSQTVTLGIVSALGRTGLNVAGYEDFIQTDAAINPGNSGGALINRKGELIGINTAIYSQTGGYQGIGFAVPSNLARRIMNDLIRFGEVRRGSIGIVQTVSITPELASELRLTSVHGALIYRMSRSSAAYDAGLRPGDVIESFGGKRIDDASQFVRELADAQIGSIVTINVLREGERFAIKVPIVKADTTRRRTAA